MTASLACLSFALLLASPPDADSTDLGGGSPGREGVPRLVVRGAPLVGHPFGLAVESAAPSAPGCFAFSSNASAIPLPAFGAVLHPSAPLLFEWPFVVGPEGSSNTLPFTIVVPAAFTGVDLVAQAVVVDPDATGGLAFTNGRRVTFGPRLTAQLFDLEAYLARIQVGDVATGDFDGDGQLDFVVTDIEGDPLGPHVLTATGFGRYSLSQSLGVDVGGRWDVRVADLNGDSIDDFAISAKVGTQRAIRVFAGRTDGTFDEFTPAIISGFSAAHVAGDLDNDGILDLVSIDFIRDDLRVNLGTGANAFATEILVGIGGRPLDLQLADFDGDGNLDACVTCADADVIQVHLGVGDGTFQAPIEFASAGQPAALAVADLNGDGLLDQLNTRDNAGVIEVRMGISTGILGPPSSIASETVGIWDDMVEELEVVDFDGDGNLDLLVASRVGPNLYRGDGTGAFGPPETVTPFEAEVLTRVRFDVADRDGDGDLDFAIARRQGSSTTTRVGLATYETVDAATASLRSPLVSATAMTPAEVAVGDFDRDGRDDLATLNNFSKGGLMISDGDGTFSALPTFMLQGSVKGVISGEFGADGLLDLALSVDSPGNRRIVLLRGDGSGSFGAPLSSPAFPDVGRLVAGDFDGDGVDDLVFQDDLSKQLVGLIASGSGGFMPPGFTALPELVSGPLIAADIDGDGLDELLQRGSMNDHTRVLVSQGDGTFDWGFEVDTRARPSVLQVADMNGDGLADLVGQGDGTLGDVLFVKLATAPGVFASPALTTSIEDGEPNGSLRIGDINGDTVADVVQLDAVLNLLVVRAGLGGGVLAPARTFEVEEDLGRLALLDTDGDSMLDVVMTSSAGDRIVVYVNGLLDD